MTQRVIPRQTGETYDCPECGWQGKFIATNGGICPDCGAEVIPYTTEPDQPE